MGGVDLGKEGGMEGTKGRKRGREEVRKPGRERGYMETGGHGDKF